MTPQSQAKRRTATPAITPTLESVRPPAQTRNIFSKLVQSSRSVWWTCWMPRICVWIGSRGISLILILRRSTGLYHGDQNRPQILGIRQGDSTGPRSRGPPGRIRSRRQPHLVHLCFVSTGCPVPALHLDPTLHWQRDLSGRYSSSSSSHKLLVKEFHSTGSLNKSTSSRTQSQNQQWHKIHPICLNQTLGDSPEDFNNQWFSFVIHMYMHSCITHRIVDSPTNCNLLTRNHKQ